MTPALKELLLEGFIPPWQDKETLSICICQHPDTIDNWVAQGTLPAPRKRGGRHRAVTVKTYDTRVHELAELFLSDEVHLATQQNAHELALEIQTTIEDWIDSRNAEIAMREYERTDGTR